MPPEIEALFVTVQELVSLNLPLETSSCVYFSFSAGLIECAVSLLPAAPAAVKINEASSYKLILILYYVIRLSHSASVKALSKNTRLLIRDFCAEISNLSTYLVPLSGFPTRLVGVPPSF